MTSERTRDFNEQTLTNVRLLLILHELSATGAPGLALATFRAIGSDLDLRIVTNVGGPRAEGFRALGPLTVLRSGPFVERMARHSRSSSTWSAAESVAGRLRSPTVLMRPGGWRPDVIYVNSAAALMTFARMTSVRRLRCPIILHVHEGPVALGIFDSLAPGLIAGTADHYIAVSRTVSTALVDQFDVPKSRITVVPPLIDERWLVAGQDLEGGLDTPPKMPIVVGGVGVPGWTKGVELWLLSAAELARRHGRQQFRFVWVGIRDDVASHQFRAMISKLGLDDLVRLEHEVPDPIGKYVDIDILMQSSWEESASLATLEFMALGKVVACYRGSGGPAEEVGETGLVVDEFSPAAMADAIGAVVDDPERRHELGQAARLRVGSGHAQELIAPQILEVIMDSAARGRAARSGDSRS